VLHVGELGLDGRIRPVPGVLPIVHAAARAGLRRVVVPAGNLAEACLTGGVDVIGAVSLADVVRLHGGGVSHEPTDTQPHLMPCSGRRARVVPDLVDVVGQDEARRALEVAAAGGHHLLLQGPPGAGKTMLASRLPGILPALDDDEAVEVSAVHSISGTFDPMAGLTRRPPFEAPHHSATAAAIIGGGSGIALPGAMSRAHRGVLFLDEAPEFNRAVLEALRQPLEDGQVRIARAYGSVTYPARFQLVLAANPCPCGQFVGQGTACTCTPMQRRGYFTKLSGPVLDRIDVRVEVPAARLSAVDAAPESSAVVAARVAGARAAQTERLTGSGVRLNGHLGGADLRGRWRPARAATARLERALDRGEISLRGYDRVLRIGWTICDLRGGDSPTAADLTSALLLREPRLAA
jgi:magnesium chelatase family protein